jgi:hypothetical protein
MKNAKKGLPTRPRGFTDEAWENFCIYWKSPAAIAESERNRANRLMGERAAYTGGSKSILGHSLELVCLNFNFLFFLNFIIHFHLSINFFYIIL